MSTFRLSVIGGLGAAMMAGVAQGQTVSTLYSFTGSTDGGLPNGGLVSSGGALYGTTLVGGSASQGTVFKVDATTGAETVLHSFVPGTDGQNPSGSLILRAAGLFGTTSSGGGGSNCLGAGCGIVFRIDAATGKEKIVYRFAGGSDGGVPFGGVIAHGGALYGTTGYYGGGYGTVFKLDPASGVETVLHGFTADDGHQPYGALIMRGGSLYGTTDAGGNNGCAQEGCGIVFKVDVASGQETETYLFGDTPDGASPLAGLVAHGGAFYGTTTWGGAGTYGSVFRIDPNTAAETVLYSFDGSHDGGNPTAGLIYVGGAIYGTASLGGVFNRNCTDGDQGVGCGVIFRVDLKSGKYKVVYRFNGLDGADPEAGLIYQDGAFFGTTFGGGTYGYGTVFKFVPK